jgi:hypothetical protein
MTTEAKIRNIRKAIAVKADKNIIHVFELKPGWVVKREGNKTFSDKTETQAEAETIGREIISKGKGEKLIIHQKDGTFRQ